MPRTPGICPVQFFIGLVFPYLLVVGMAYVGARGGLQSRDRGKAGPRTGQLPPRGEAGRGRHGRSVARAASHAGTARRHQADSPVARRAERDLAEAVRRFEREAQVIARLRSPHTVDLFDFGIAADGAFYYAMELLDGLDADALVRRFGPMPPERAIYLLRQVCHSLSEAQSCGLVHRDIKPANIFLCRYGEDYDFVKVLDFGIVRTSVTAGRPARCTPGERDPGTPAFMAPRAGNRQRAGRTRRHLFRRLRGVLAPDRAARVHRRDADGDAHEARPGSATASIGPDEPPNSQALDDLVLSCLAKDPADRPQSSQRALASARRHGRREGVDAGAGAEVVGDAPRALALRSGNRSSLGRRYVQVIAPWSDRTS